ncbi:MULTISPECIES: BTAD domain-containing putative transcriptional regulator [Nocardia]|uniref:BTAD domain-containing putative transcriptional regulator n=1 Tax=Nocardia elegans TaxID=300029 RepID=A0ABW6TNB8_9NOCA|nr:MULTISPECIES: BTAD domain-containing putative transcriptional regulator [Nocardia]
MGDPPDTDDSSGAQLRLRVLGGLAATVGGRPVDLGGLRQRTLLAALIAAFPHEVSADRLLEQVWHDARDPSVNSLHFGISTLRNRLEPDRRRGGGSVIARCGTRYLLDLPADRIDAHRFAQHVIDAESACATGDLDASLRSYEAALADWRGAPYADVADAEFVRPEIVRLTTLELRARKALVQLRLDAGRADAALADAEDLVSAHPLDERVWELLALARYRAGRQPEALAALRDIRRLLDSELGIEPGVRLRELETAILRHDEDLLSGSARRTTAAQGSVASAPQMPVPRTQLIGRSGALDDIGRAVRTHRLVTLVGTGGVGKTRLALETCRRLPAGDGPWWVDLAPVESDQLVAATVAAAIQVRGAATLDRLANVLPDRECTLLLDNCEHLLDGVAAVASVLLSRCPRIRILATSREALAVDGERVVEVLPLDEADAVELFATRAAGVVDGWTLDERVREPVRQICADLDGIPLAVELAAAQLRILSEQQIADGLADRFTLLAGGARTAPARQRRLVDTIDWSYRMLGPAEARLLREIAVFAGSFDIDAAAAVHGAPSPLAVLETLTGLVRRSLLRVQPASSPRRYRMLQSIREFAMARCEADELVRVRAAHRRCVLERSQLAATHLRDARSAQMLDALGTDVAEHRSAIASAFADGDPGYVLRLAAALYWFWYRRGFIEEGIEAITSALAACERCGHEVDGATLASALAGLGGLYYLSGDPVRGAESTERAARVATDAGDHATAAWMRTWTTYMHAVVTASPATASAARAAVAEVSAAGHPWQLAEALMIEGMILRFVNRLDAARDALREAVSVAERCGHRWPVASASWTLARCAMDTGDPTDARTALRTMQTALESDGDVTSWLVMVHLAAAIAARSGRADDGARLLGAVRALGGRIGFLPEAMDPTDAPREAAAVRTALSEREFDAGLAAGAVMTRAEVNALVSAVGAEPTRTLSGG